jgi:GT2 family glycosyltransferase
MPRPPVDVVVPFAGSDDELRRLHARLAKLKLSDEDTLTIVDNRKNGTGLRLDGVMRANERQSSYYARNQGAARGHASWIVFVDADLEVAPDLLDRYFEQPPAEDTGFLIGDIEPTLTVSTAIARYGFSRRHLSTQMAAKPGWEYAQTANAAVRRVAFEAVGGFEWHVRSGGDADLSFRLTRSGHAHEYRPGAVVRHPPRSTLRALVRQFLRYGAGRQWLHERYPEFAPPRSLPRLTVRAAKSAPRALKAFLREDRDDALAVFLDPVVAFITELGRLMPNESGASSRLVIRHVVRVLRERRHSAVSA